MAEAFELKIDLINKSNKDIKLCIGVLYFGEKQLKTLLKSLIKSSINAEIKFIELYIIGYKQNLDAHLKIYQWFNANKDNPRIKIDADMNISLDTIKKIITTREKKRIIFPVFDFISKSYIYGVNYFPPSHTLNIEKITPRFPDLLTDDFVLSKERVGIMHCQNASINQVLNFFIHRIIKLFASKTKLKIPYLKLIFKSIINNFRIIIPKLPFVIKNLYSIFFQGKEYKTLDDHEALNENKIKSILENYKEENISFQSQ